MKKDHNGLIYRCSLCKARIPRITEQSPGQCDHDGHRMSETAADYLDKLERENAELRARLDAAYWTSKRLEGKNAELRKMLGQAADLIEELQAIAEHPDNVDEFLNNIREATERGGGCEEK